MAIAAFGVIVDGVTSGVEINEAYIQIQCCSKLAKIVYTHGRRCYNRLIKITLNDVVINSLSCAY
jgi:hypothetical protein